MFIGRNISILLERIMEAPQKTIKKTCFSKKCFDISHDHVRRSLQRIRFTNKTKRGFDDYLIILRLKRDSDWSKYHRMLADPNYQRVIESHQRSTEVIKVLTNYIEAGCSQVLL